MIKLHQLAFATVISLPLTACDYASNWQISNGFCQTLSQDDQFMLRIKPDSIGIIDRTPNCNGRGTFPMTGSNVAVNHTSYPTSAFCNSETQNFAIQLMMSTKDIAEVISTLKSGEDVHVSTFGTQFTIDASGFARTCAAIINQKVAGYDPLQAQDQMMENMGYEKQADGTWFKKSKMADANASGGVDVKMDKGVAAPKGGFYAGGVSTGAGGGDFGNIDTGGVSDGGLRKPASASPPPPVELTQEIYDQALSRAQSTYLLTHPGTDLSNMAWERIHRPDKTLNGRVLREMRYTTFNPATTITSDIDVEIEADGTIGYAITKDRPSAVVAAAVTPPAASAVDSTVNAFCTLDNGKTVSVYAAEGQDYRYTYSDKNDRQELALVEGVFGVKAFHYYAPLGMGAAHYMRFNKGTYDYVLLNKDTGKEEFHGIRVYNNGTLISSHECITPLALNTENLPQNDHADSDKAGDYFTQ